MSYSRHSAQTAARHLARFISDDQDRIAAALCATPVVAARAACRSTTHGRATIFRAGGERGP